MSDAADDEIWFWGDANTEAEERFLTVLRARAEAWNALDIGRDHTQAWPDNDPFCIHVDLSDPSHNLIYGTLRIDFDGARLVGGWSDSQLVHPIDPAEPDSFETSAFASAEEAAVMAGRWLEAQLCRPIERRESLLWEVSWVLADTDCALW